MTGLPHAGGTIVCDSVSPHLGHLVSSFSVSISCTVPHLPHLKSSIGIDYNSGLVGMSAWTAPLGEMTTKAMLPAKLRYVICSDDAGIKEPLIGIIFSADPSSNWSRTTASALSFVLIRKNLEPFGNCIDTPWLVKKLARSRTRTDAFFRSVLTKHVHSPLCDSSVYYLNL